VQLPNTIESIEGSVFEGCASLTAFEMPIAVKSVGSSAFKGCTALQSITLSTALKKVGGSAFAKCASLRNVKSNASLAPKIEKSTFKDVPVGAARLEVPKGTRNFYTVDKYWTNFGNIVEEY
jgi:hypothetical protein